LVRKEKTSLKDKTFCNDFDMQVLLANQKKDFYESG